MSPIRTRSRPPRRTRRQPGRREPLLGAPRGDALPPGCRRARRGRAGRLPSTKDAELWVIRGDHAVNQRADPYQRIVYRDPHPLDDLPALFDNGNGMRIMLQSHGLKGAANSNDPLVAAGQHLRHGHQRGRRLGCTSRSTSTASRSASSWSWKPASIRPRTSRRPPPIRTPSSRRPTYNVENLYDFRDDPFDGCDFVGNTGCPGVNPPFDFVPASEAAYQKHLGDLAPQIAGPMHAPDLLMIQEAEDQDICTVAGRRPGVRQHEQPRRQAGHAAGAGAGHQRGRWPDLPGGVRPRRGR